MKGKLILLAVLSLAACGKYDDSALISRLDQAESRTAALEKERLQALNADVETVRSLVRAIRGNVFVSLVDEQADYVEIQLTNGVSMRFSTRDMSGEGPVVGVRLGDDGGYYWTLDGELLLVDGKPVRADGDAEAHGETGTAGLTPEILVENGRWIVVYGSERQDVGAVGDTRMLSLFLDVIPGNNEVTILLKDGSSLSLARSDGFALNLGGDSYEVVSGGEQYVPYTFMSGKAASVSVLSAPGITVEVLPDGKGRGRIHAVFADDFRSGTVLAMLVDASGDFLSKPISFESK